MQVLQPDAGSHRDIKKDVELEWLLCLASSLKAGQGQQERVQPIAQRCAEVANESLGNNPEKSNAA
jgi:hypothetical protein